MENDLTTLNGVTFSAPKLEVLLLAGNWKLEAMPKQFLKGIENLKVLDLSKCHKLKSLPREIGNLRQLTHLDLYDCENLKSLPEEVGKLTQLIHLDLSFCHHLEKLPKSIGCLQSLQWLGLKQCYDLKYLPSTMGDLRSLQYLSLAGPSINGVWGKRSRKLYGQAFAVDICKLTALTELHISGLTCEIVELCDQLLKLVSKLVKLKSFHICEFVELGTLPDVMQSMVHLEEFWVCCCERIKILPSFITLFSKLKVLRLDGMSSLESLPALNTLKMLSTLSIKGCESIKKLPDSFTSSDAFPSLKELDCLGSGLVEFSEVEDGAMPKLQILNLDCTDIKSLPDTLIYLKNLKVVYICQDGFDDLCEKFKNSWLSGKFEMFFPMSEDRIRTFEWQPCEVRKLSLMENDLTTLNGVTFSAPKLDVLLLAQDEKLEAMPKQFLKGIENLKVLEPGTSQGKSR
jgi:Leucine-rich repeat (LRR) protein